MFGNDAEHSERSQAEGDHHQAIQQLDHGIKNQRKIAAAQKRVAEEAGESQVARGVGDESRPGRDQSQNRRDLDDFAQSAKAGVLGAQSIN